MVADVGDELRRYIQEIATAAAAEKESAANIGKASRAKDAHIATMTSQIKSLTNAVAALPQAWPTKRIRRRTTHPGQMNVAAMPDSPTRGTVGTQAGGYLNKVPLPKVPLLQSTAALVTCAVPHVNPTCYLQVPRIPTWSDLTRSYLGAIRSTMLPLALM